MIEGPGKQERKPTTKDRTPIKNHHEIQIMRSSGGPSLLEDTRLVQPGQPNTCYCVFANAPTTKNPQGPGGVCKWYIGGFPDVLLGEPLPFVGGRCALQRGAAPLPFMYSRIEGCAWGVVQGSPFTFKKWPDKQQPLEKNNEE